MASAPFVWRRDGRPDWGAMWTTFCDLALHGGPPQRGALQALRGPSVDDRAARSAPEIAAELRRGIEETTGLSVEAAEPGWIAITCASARMAAWLCAAIILENVDARVEGARLLRARGTGLRARGSGQERGHSRGEDASLLAGAPGIGAGDPILIAGLPPRPMRASWPGSRRTRSS